MLLSLTESKKRRPIKRRGKILIVDDDELFSYVMREMLQAEGYQVRTADNGRYGFYCYLLFAPDVVVTDIQMPETSGFEMMKRIRMHDRRAKAIYMSGDVGSFRSRLEEERQAYGARVIGKPFTKFELVDLIATVTENRERRSTAAQ